MLADPKLIDAQIARLVAADPGEAARNDLQPMRSVRLSEFLAEMVPPSYTVDGLFIRGYAYAITAPSGHGKTAVTLPLAFSVALGVQFAGRDTLHSRVLYIAGENPDDVRLRVRAMLDVMDLDVSDLESQLQFIDRSFTLADRHAELMALIEEGDFGLVILDTDQALSSDADENSNRDRIEHAKRVRMLTKTKPRPTVIDLCHPPVNAGKNALRPRGGSAFLAEIDGNAGLWMEEGETRTELFRTTKFRGPMFDPILFDIRVVELRSLTDSKGRPMTTAIALPVSDDSIGEADEEARQRRMALLSDVSCNPESTVRLRAGRLKASKSTVSRDTKYLVSRGAIEQFMDGHTITAKGKKWLSAI